MQAALHHARLLARFERAPEPAVVVMQGKGGRGRGVWGGGRGGGQGGGEDLSTKVRRGQDGAGAGRDGGGALTSRNPDA